MINKLYVITLLPIIAGCGGCGSNLRNTTVQDVYEILGPEKAACLVEAIRTKQAAFDQCDRDLNVSGECSTDAIIDHYKAEGLKCLSGND